MTEPAPPPSEPRWRSDMGVELVKASASDSDVIWAARVSTAGEQSLESLQQDPERSRGLVRYLVRNRHGSPFEHNSFTFLVTAPIFVFREFQRHRIGFCVAGDTLVTTESAGPHGTRTTRRTRIDELHDRWHHGVRDPLGRTGHPRSVRAQQVRVLNEESLLFERAPVLDVVDSGTKPVMTLRAETGHVLRCTVDHAVLTNEGWVKAGDLEPGHLVAVAGERATHAARQHPPAPRAGTGVRTSLQRHPTRAVGRCHRCGAPTEREELVPDHVVPVAADPTRALDVRDPAPTRRPRHRDTSATEQRPARRGATAGAEFVRYERVGDTEETPTFDLSVAGPWHNFLANGFVVHNSYNEESARYRELEPVFYVPGPERALVQQGRPGHYEFVPGSREQHDLVTEATRRACTEAHRAYREMLAAGVAREVARGVLPVATYSSMYATCNARSLMAFLSLRTHHPEATFPSHPQREIAMVAEQMEAHLARLMPITHAAFCDAGRVSP